MAGFGVPLKRKIKRKSKRNTKRQEKGNEEQGRYVCLCVM